MGFHIYTDHWWRNPKHAVTTEATLVEVQAPERPTGTVSSGFYNSAPSGHFQEVWADVVDPATGATVRAHGDLYSSFGSFTVGQRLRVRWSAKRKEFNLYNESTAPEGESPAGGAFPMSATGLSADQTARVQQVLGGLGLGEVPGIRVVHADHDEDPIADLERLADLRERGALTDEEFEQQKRRILGHE